MNLDRGGKLLEDVGPDRVEGRVRQVIGLIVQGEGLEVPVGAACEILAGAGPVACEVVGSRDDVTLLMPFGELSGVRRGDQRRLPLHPPASVGRPTPCSVASSIAGDAPRRPPPVSRRAPQPLPARAPPPLYRERVASRWAPASGDRRPPHVRPGPAHRALLRLGRRQERAPRHVARGAAADVAVVALVGERGREVRGVRRERPRAGGPEPSVVVVETSERPGAAPRARAVRATAVAEYFRDGGADVLLLMDSLTRMANAQREIGLSAGEPPATRGYPPSVFATLPRLLERAGRAGRGSVTGDLHGAGRGRRPQRAHRGRRALVLDGHLWLSRDLAHRGHYPAIDMLRACRGSCPTSRRPSSGRRPRGWRPARDPQDAEDLINVGRLRPRLKRRDRPRPCRCSPAILKFLRQSTSEAPSLAEARQALLELAKGFEGGAGG